MHKILVACLLLISSNIMAQSHGSRRSDNFIAGISAGATFSQVDGDTFGGYHQAGVSVGGFVFTKINRNVDLQLDMAFKQKGSSKSPDVKNNDYVEYYIKLNYIELPLVARYHFWHMSAEAGLSLATLITSHEGDENGDYNADTLVPFAHWELATILGVNYYFTKQLWLNGRYGYSLNPIRVPYNGDIKLYEIQHNYLTGQTGQFNNVISITLNYAFK